jgi:hypothetical protein
MGLSGPIEAAMPALIGGVASRWGIRAAVTLLALAPVGVLLLAPRGNRRQFPGAAPRRPDRH